MVGEVVVEGGTVAAHSRQASKVAALSRTHTRAELQARGGVEEH